MIYDGDEGRTSLPAGPLAGEDGPELGWRRTAGTRPIVFLWEREELYSTERMYV